MIKKKLKTCKGCGLPKLIWKDGKCQDCCRPDYGELKGNSTLKSNKGLNPISKKGRKRKQERSKKRSVYFEYHIDRCQKSEESGLNIGSPTRANIAHLFDKGRHPSLEDNLDNYVYLTFGEHSDFDTYLFAHEFDKLEKNFPNSWKIACERYRKLLPLCKEKTNFYFKLKEYLDE